jgi:hypothetical protein
MNDPTTQAILSAETILAESAKPKTSLLEQIGHFSTAESVEDYSFDASQVAITPTQRSLVALMVRGFSMAAACRKLHCNYAAACRWKTSPWWDAICEEERIKWLQSEGIDSKQEAFAPLVGVALESLKSAMESEDDKVRLAACQIVFEQFFDSRRPVGRPRKPSDTPESPPDLSDLRIIAEQRVVDMTNSIRENGHVSVVANG